jgi:hypothetical protein
VKIRSSVRLISIIYLFTFLIGCTDDFNRDDNGELPDATCIDCGGEQFVEEFDSVLLIQYNIVDSLSRLFGYDTTLREVNSEDTAVILCEGLDREEAFSISDRVFYVEGYLYDPCDGGSDLYASIESMEPLFCGSAFEKIQVESPEDHVYWGIENFQDEDTIYKEPCESIGSLIQIHFSQDDKVSLKVNIDVSYFGITYLKMADDLILETWSSNDSDPVSNATSTYARMIFQFLLDTESPLRIQFENSKMILSRNNKSLICHATKLE